MEIFNSVKEYRDYFFNLVEEERKAEKEFHLNEIKRLSGNERQKRGRAVLGLKMKYVGEFLDFNIYRFNRNNMPDHQIKVGDIVLVSRGEPLKFNQEAVVSSIGRNFIEVYSKEKIFRAKLYRLDLFVNDITFKRMESALDRVEKGDWKMENGLDILLGRREPEVVEVDEVSEKLNFSQNEALKRAIKSEMFLIQGPPGTGKTTTLAEIVRKSEGRKLVVADSNTAVDNILSKLTDLNIVRIGHPAKMDKTLMKFSLDVKVRRDKNYKEIEKMDKKIEDLKHLQEKRTKKPTPGRRRGLSDEEILALAKEGKGKRGVKAEWVKEMAEWVKIQNNINKLYDKKRALSEEIVNSVLDNAEVVFATNSGAGGEFLENREFDVVFIDEAAQALEPATLIPLIKAKRAIFVGDEKQLPPTILSNRKELSVSMFERFKKIYKNHYTLQIQYRMNEAICHFPSCEFYNCELLPDESVKNIKLSDLIETDKFDKEIEFIDTCGKFLEKRKKDSPSKYNPLEAEFVLEKIEELLEAGVKEEWIGVITPYKDHEEYIKKLMKSGEVSFQVPSSKFQEAMDNKKLLEVEVKSVDGFQGREKEIIILSLVRANEREEIGFLSDIRRLNVAITRAKRKLIIIGDAKTLICDKTYRDLIEYVKEKDYYVKL